jgi:hypothetical protein
MVARLRPRERRPFGVRVRIARRSVVDGRELEWTVTPKPTAEARFSSRLPRCFAAAFQIEGSEVPTTLRPSAFHGLGSISSRPPVSLGFLSQVVGLLARPLVSRRRRFDGCAPDHLPVSPD